MEAWTDLTVVHRGTPVVIDGIGFSAIGRLKFLRLMQQRAGERRDATPNSERRISAEELKATTWSWRPTARTRSSAERPISARPSPRSATSSPGSAPRRSFPTLTQTFVENEHGTFNAHHYRHSPRDEHLRVRVRCGDLAARRVRLDGRGGHACLLRASLRATPWRAPSRLEQVRMAELSQREKCTLARGQRGADRRRAAHRALLDRLGHAPGDGGRHCADKVARSSTRTKYRKRWLRSKRPAGRSSRSWSRRRTRAATGTIASPST